MSVLTPKRVVLFAVAVLVGAPLFASYPSPRTGAEMAYDEKNAEAVLFGGRGTLDGATGVVHATDETWVWTGASWVQRFPLTSPPARSAHAMVYDRSREFVVLFGGRVEPSEPRADATYLNDTWIWQNGNWSQVVTAQAPAPRNVAAIVYDDERERVILYGGTGLAEDGKTPKALYDMWEFDGTNWIEIGGTLPQVAKPIIGYDRTRDELILLGVKEGTLERLMYRYDPSTDTWTAVTPTTLPTCINEGHLFFDEVSGKLRFLGGLCPTGTPELEEVYEWDGTDWAKKTMLNAATRGIGQASAYDARTNRVILFGGSSVLGNTISAYTSIVASNRFVIPVTPPARPSARTLTASATDPVTNTVWVYGGLDEFKGFYHEELWGYRNNQWFRPSATENKPTGCTSPLGAFDTDRGRFVVVCSGGVTHEWNGVAWQKFEPSKKPDARQFAAMVYDQKLKKTVLFGGFSGNNYNDQTWTWDGSSWTEVKINDRDRPGRRGLMAMWYDPLAQKTILYGGFGRQSIDDDIERFSDMWAFDGSKWTKLNVTETPGMRFGPQIAVNPTTGRLLLFGGLRAQQLDEDSITQFFDNDTWEWDGSTSRWTRLTPPRSPSVRQNGTLAWDPLAGEMVLFSGHANGFYRSDVWTWNGLTWEPQVEHPGRRRAAGR